MIQEYLLLKPEEKKLVEKYKPKDIKREISSFDQGNYYRILFSNDGESEHSAKILSEVDIYIRNTFQVVCLQDGCSNYFCNRLYPIVSEFEYNLRKLLYLSNAKNHDEKTAERIGDLESKDLGSLFTLLFIDESYMLKIKQHIKDRNRDVFSKQEVIAAIDSYDENVLWDQLLGKTIVPTLCKHFQDVRNYRNDVMHLHNMSWEKYRAIKALYRKINNELEQTIIEIEAVEKTTTNAKTYNRLLDYALDIQEILDHITDTHETPFYEMLQQWNEEKIKWEQMFQLSQTEMRLQSMLEQQRELQRQYLEICQPNPMITELQRQIEEYSRLKNNAFSGVEEVLGSREVLGEPHEDGITREPVESESSKEEKKETENKNSNVEGKEDKGDQQ